jgi:V/A-type H+-transporting ATPase subunit I
MTRVIIVGPRHLERKVIDTLYQKRALHIEDFTPEEGETVFKIGTPLEGADRASGLLIKLRSFKTALGLENAPPPAVKPNAGDIEGKIEASVVALEMSITSAADDRAKLEAEVSDLKTLIEELRPFERLPVPLAELSGYKSLAVFTGYVREGFAGPLQAAVRHLDTVVVDPADVVAVFVDAESREAAVKVLLDHGFQELRVPRGEGLASEEIQKVDRLLNDPASGLVKRLASKEKELGDLKEKHAGFILAAAELLEMEVERCEAPLRAAQSPNTFVVEGYVPSTEVAQVRAAVEQTAGGRIHFESEAVPQLAPPTPHGHGGGHGEEAHAKEGAHGPSAEDTPVALQNPKAAGAFEYLVRLISLPKYNEVDPTMMMFVVFPVFFGIMLGDIGYGAAVFFLGQMASKQQNADLAAVGKLLRLGGFFSFVFGFVFGEFFGFEVLGSEPGPLKFWGNDLFVPGLVGVVGGFDGYFPISRLHSVPMLLSATIWIGIIHIFFGMVLGFRNQLRAHGFEHALFAKGSWIIILVSGVVWMRAMTAVMFSGSDLGSVTSDGSFLAGIAVFVVGIVLLIKGEGGVGAVELPSLLGNILSYSRLLAIGLSGVAIALTANLPLNWAVSEGSVLSYAVGIPLAVLGHLLGVFLGILGPGLHALRLHYVEFFTKFYQGGGRAFAPLGKEPKYVTP